MEATAITLVKSFAWLLVVCKVDPLLNDDVLNENGNRKMEIGKWK
jgi:hypothetical protein